MKKIECTGTEGVEVKPPAWRSKYGTQQEYAGPPSPAVFNCIYCGEGIVTLWAPMHMGMLTVKGHCLVDNYVVHDACLEKQIAEHPFE